MSKVGVGVGSGVAVGVGVNARATEASIVASKSPALEVQPIRINAIIRDEAIMNIG